jgi:uncharacterized protein YcbX
MCSQIATPRLANVRLHPVKALDPVSVNEACIGPNGGLDLDRVWALYSADGRWVNGKRTAAMHLIRAAYAPDISTVTLTVPGDRRRIPAMAFAFPGDTDGPGEWFSMYFEQAIHVRYTREGFPDDGLAPGPTIVSTASLEAVCDWFPGMALAEARRRFRATLEIEGVSAFWEDQLFAESERSVVRFKIGDVAFEGSNPCARCPVPSRDSHTGAADGAFQKRFSELRRAQLPPWAPAARFDHFYRLATNTRVPTAESGKLLRLGDPVSLP